MQIRNLLAIVLMVVVATIDYETTRADTYTSPAPAGEAYTIQGEYSGNIDTWGGSWGAQVVSLGNSRVSVFFYPGGLPGDGFLVDSNTKKLDAKLDGKTAEGSSDEFRVSIGNSRLSVMDLDGKSLGDLAKLNRQSTTLGAVGPEGSIVLFDGTGVDKFRDASLVDGRYLSKGCESIESFGDHQLHIEFNIPFMPKDRGQGRGNSGVYVQGRYEIQILDSFGLEVKDNECGGIYQVAKPLHNMCYPPLTWQTYDIDFTAAKHDAQGGKTSNAIITVRQNGVIIHDSVELPSHTPGKYPEASSPGPLYLQDHGNPVVFQNIWVVKK